MSLVQNIKDTIAGWLGIKPAAMSQSVTIRESTTYELQVLRNKLWYRGDPVELDQFYHELKGISLDGFSRIPSTRFWAAAPHIDNLIRKFHTGLPRLIADKLASIVADDMNDPEMEQNLLTRWEAIAEENEFSELLKHAVTKALAEGDGAFKICLDPEVSDLPLIEFFSGGAVEYKYKRGKLQEIIFYTEYFKENKQYKLCEHYGIGYVNYVLLDSLGHEVDITILPETEMLENATFAGKYIMGVPLRFYENSKFDNRGESIFEGKSDAFDALDEIVSTWLDGVRAGRVKQYIPADFVPRNESDGTLRKPDIFNSYIVKGMDLSEDADNKIEVVQGDIKFEGLLASYVTMLDLCLQGLISPSTLGIDVKKMDNAESQREKEKTTLYTRDTLIGVLMKVLPRLVDITLRTEDNITKKASEDAYDGITFEWGQYANPAFEAMVETISKAKAGGIMSVDRAVQELYGDTMTEEEKQKEIALIKGEAALTLDAPPGVNDDVKDETGTGEENLDDKKKELNNNAGAV